MLPPCVFVGSDFFLKVSERKLQQKQQKDQQGLVDLTAEDGSKALESVASELTVN